MKNSWVFHRYSSICNSKTQGSFLPIRCEKQREAFDSQVIKSNGRSTGVLPPNHITTQQSQMYSTIFTITLTVFLIIYCTTSCLRFTGGLSPSKNRVLFTGLDYCQLDKYSDVLIRFANWKGSVNFYLYDHGFKETQIPVRPRIRSSGFNHRNR